MHEHEVQPDYGTGKKNLQIYFLGLMSCIILTVIAFGAVMANAFSNTITFIIIYSAACIQFLVQLICFLRLNTETPQGRNNVTSFLFTGVILITIIVGSLWIMWNTHYRMM